MFATSLGLLLAHLGAYIILPLIPGMIAAWILIDDRFRGWLYYIISRFLGIGVLSYGLFLLQFVRFGIDRAAYAILLLFLVVILAVRIQFTRMTWRRLLHVLPVSFRITGRKGKSNWQKAGIVLLGLFIVGFIGVTFCFVTSFPSYGDDAFGNRHMPVMNILYDGGVKIFGDTAEILGRGRLGYPIMVPTMQAFISNVIGGYNDIYINIFQWLLFTMFALFVGIYVYLKKKNFLSAMVGPALIMSLPLMFMHVTQGYMDLPSAIYTALAVISFYEWLQSHGTNDDLILGITMLSIVSYIKNDGFVVYMTGTLGALAIYLLVYRTIAREKLQVFKKPQLWITLIAVILFFIAPFTFIKSYYNLGFNQAAGADTGLGLASTLHWEIFPAIRRTIWSMNNYSVAPLLFVLVILWKVITRRSMPKQHLFLILAPAVILGLFILVFLVTENYKFVLDQTTVNRVFTMVLVIFLSRIAILMNNTHSHSND